MDKLVALCCFMLSLLGVDVGGSTFVHRASVEGREALYSRTQVHAGVARFECVRSESGQCHYLLQPLACGAAPGVAARGEACGAAALQRFTVARGESRRRVALADFELCVSTDGRAAGAGCADAVPVAPAH